MIARLEAEAMAKASKTKSKQKKQPEDQSVNNEASDHDEGNLSASIKLLKNCLSLSQFSIKLIIQ